MQAHKTLFVTAASVSFLFVQYCSGQCSVQDEYLVAVNAQRQTGQPPLHDFYRIWITSLQDTLSRESLDEHCVPWARNELMALYAATGDYGNAVVVAREILNSATSRDGMLLASNNLIGMIQRQFPIPLPDEARAECCLVATTTIQQFPTIDDMIADTTTTWMWSHYVPIMLVEASCQSTVEQKIARLNSSLTSIDRLVAARVDLGVEPQVFRDQCWRELAEVYYANSMFDDLMSLIHTIAASNNHKGSALALQYWEKARRAGSQQFEQRIRTWILELSNSHEAKSMILMRQSEEKLRPVQSDVNVPAPLVEDVIFIVSDLLAQLDACRTDGAPANEALYMAPEELRSATCAWKLQKAWLLTYRTTRHDDAVVSLLDALTGCPIDEQLESMARKLDVHLR